MKQSSVWAAGVAVVLFAVAGAAWYWRGGAADRAVNDFARLANAGDPRALDLLGPAPVFDDEPVSEEVADARQAEYYLRLPGMKVGEVRPGEPDREGRMRPARHRYTLVTKAQGSTPTLRVRDAAGAVASQSLFIINPDIVVEVSDGKLRALRAEMHRD